MNLFYLLGKICVAFALAGLIGLLSALLVLSVLLVVVNIFNLNYNGNNYWVLSFSLLVWWTSWILSFVFLLSYNI